MTCDELFLFAGSYGDYALVRYLQKDNPNITEAKIPGIHNGHTVRLIELFEDIERYGGSAEAIAWLMEYKNRKFGFDGGEKNDL